MFMAIDNPPENAYENVGWINNMRRGGEREEWVHVCTIMWDWVKNDMDDICSARELSERCVKKD